MKKLQFERIGDVNSDFPYLLVYVTGIADAFMEIGINEEKSINFVIYPNLQRNYSLNIADWNEILRMAEEFLPKALADEQYERERSSSSLGQL